MAVSVWGQLNTDVMTGAIAMQSMALAEITKAYNPDPEPVEFIYEDFMKEADSCGHRWGEECNCTLCQRLQPMFTTLLEQVNAAQQQEQNGGT